MPRRDADESEEVGLCGRVVRAGASSRLSFLNSGHSVQRAQTPCEDRTCLYSGTPSFDVMVKIHSKGDRSTGRCTAPDQQAY